MIDTRRANQNWIVTNNKGTSDISTWEQLQLAVLMDLRDELQKLNRLLGCQNFIEIPTILREIRRNTTKKKRKKKLSVSTHGKQK